MRVVPPGRPPVVVTRPQPEADRWCTALAAAGWSGVALPLITIEPLTGDAAVAHCRAGVAGYAAVFCVSAQAVHAFWGATPPTWGPETRFWAPGPGTAKALSGLGVPPTRINSPAPDAEQFDSEALWAVVGAGLRPGDRVLVVRGGGPQTPAGSTGQGRDWLAQRCAAAGALVDWCVAYRRTPPVWGAAQRGAAQQALDQGALWVFSSSEAVQNLAQLWPSFPWGRMRVLATHPRIAETLLAQGVLQVSRCKPTLQAVLAGLESVAHGHTSPPTC